MKTKLAFSGKMTTGKSTLSNQLMIHYGFKTVSIGSTIKKASSFLVENPMMLKQYLLEMINQTEASEHLYSNLLTSFKIDFKNSEWIKDSKGVLQKNQDYRDLLQMVATEARSLLGDNVWCEFALTEANFLTKRNTPVVIDDLRLPIEKELFEQNTFNIVRLDVEKSEQKRRLLKMYGKIDQELLNHPTETALDNSEFDLRIDTTHLSLEETTSILFRFVNSNQVISF